MGWFYEYPREENEVVHECRIHDHLTSEYRFVYIVDTMFYWSRKTDPYVQWLHVKEVARVMEELKDRHPSWYLHIETFSERFNDGFTARKGMRILYTVIHVNSWVLDRYVDRCMLPRNMEDWPDYQPA